MISNEPEVTMSRTRSLALGAVFHTVFAAASLAALALWARFADVLRHPRADGGH